MTAKKQTETGVRKSRKLKLNKQTLQDLSAGKGHADGVRGGRDRNDSDARAIGTCVCSLRNTGCH